MNDAEAVDLGERLARLEDVVDRIVDGELVVRDSSITSKSRPSR